jgi:hypothetical protein
MRCNLQQLGANRLGCYESTRQRSEINDTDQSTLMKLSTND